MRKGDRTMKQLLEQAVVMKVGDTIYTPFEDYSNENESLCITTIESIYEKDGEIYIVDSDGDRLKSKWLGISFFLSKEDIKYWYDTMKSKFERGN